MRGGYRSQATLIGGTILLIVLVSVVIPLILQLNRAATSIEQSIRLATQVKQKALQEKVMVAFAYNGTNAVIYVNNTGTVRVVIEKVILLNKTSGEPLSGDICGSPNLICGIIDVGYASNNPLVSNAPPAYDDCKVGILKHGSPENLECLDSSGKVAVLDPGDVLYISIDPALLPLLNNTVVYAESAYGVIHPVVSPPGAPGKGGAGLPIPPSAIPRGLYTPISGYILWGYEELDNFTYATAIHPPFRVSTLGPSPYYDVVGEFDDSQRLYCGGIPFETAGYYFNTRNYLGTYNITFTVSQESYLYVYTSNGWQAILLEPGNVYTIYGYVGAIAILSPKYYSISGIRLESSCPYSGQPLIVLDGWAYGILINGRPVQLTPPQLVYPETKSQLAASGVLAETDVDENNITEYTLRTFKQSVSWDALDADGSGATMYAPVSSDYGYSDDVIAYNVTILRDITGVDAIQVGFKAIVTFNYLITTDFTPNPEAYMVRPVIVLALLKLDKAKHKWVIVDYKTIDFRLKDGAVYWVNVLFPTNSSDVYRVVIYVYDPYGLINVGTDAVHGWCSSSSILGCTAYYNFMSTLELHVHIEHVAIQYYVYNPLLRRVPAVYLVNITGVPYWPNGTRTAYGTFGYINASDLRSYWSVLLSSLNSLGIHPIIINDWNMFKVLLGSRDAPVAPLVVFLHGPILPIDSNGITLYDPEQDAYITVKTPEEFVYWLSEMVKYRGWVVVFPYGPPLAFAWDTAIDNYYYNDPNLYVSGALLSTLLSDLGITGASATYVYTRYSGSVLANYTVGRTSLAFQAMRAFRIWWLPLTMYGNYSIGPVAVGTSVYNAFLGHIFYENTTLPDGTSGLAVGAVYVPAGEGAVVLIAAPRPGVIPPRSLAYLTLDLGLYTWKVLWGG